MKRLLLGVMLMLGLHGQTTHQATLIWTDPGNPVGTTYNIYRQASACPSQVITSTTGFTRLNSTPVTGLTFVDTPLTVGSSYCYVVTAMVGTLESAPSNGAGGTPFPFSPVNLQITVK